MMTSCATAAPQIEQPNPLVDGRSGGALSKPTNSPELGWEPLSGRPNEESPPKLGALPMPQPMATEGQPKEACPRGLGTPTEAPRRVWGAR